MSSNLSTSLTGSMEAIHVTGSDSADTEMQDTPSTPQKETAPAVTEIAAEPSETDVKDAASSRDSRNADIDKSSRYAVKARKFRSVSESGASLARPDRAGLLSGNAENDPSVINSVTVSVGQDSDVTDKDSGRSASESSDHGDREPPETAKGDAGLVRAKSTKRKLEEVDESGDGQEGVKKGSGDRRSTEEGSDDGGVATTSSPQAKVGKAEFFVKDWEFVQTLGEGAYGEVKLAYNILSREAVAVKIVDTTGHGVVWDDVRKEVCIHRMIDHPNVIKFYGIRHEGEMRYLFLEYACGGEIFDRIEPDVGMPQEKAQKYFRQLIDGMEYLHKKGITHRDIKPENLLLDENDNVKIADFGLATVFRYQNNYRELERLCGSAPYLAPEVTKVLQDKSYHAQPADIWACGIVLVALLAGELPWDAAVLVNEDYVMWRECHIERRPWHKIDNLALSLLRRILVDKPEKRYTINDIRRHPWYRKDFSSDNTPKFSAGPKRRRGRSSESDQSPSPVSCSQPTPLSRIPSDPQPSRQSTSDSPAPSTSAAADQPISFSQPAQADDMLLSSQINSTQSSQTPMQKLVRRMTRFFSKQSRSDVVKQLDQIFSQLGYTWKHSSSHLLTVVTTDKRQSKLTFKAMILEMGESLLIDFRLSKGDGLEFKRHFMRIRDQMKPWICRVPATWPNLPDV